MDKQLITTIHFVEGKTVASVTVLNKDFSITVDHYQQWVMTQELTTGIANYYFNVTRVESVYTELQ